MSRAEWCEGSGRAPAGVSVTPSTLARCNVCGRLLKTTTQGHLRQHRIEGSVAPAPRA